MTATPITGVGVSSGLVIGPACRMPAPVADPTAGSPVPQLPASERDAAAAQIARSMAAVRDELLRRAELVTGEAAEVLEATSMMAADPTLESAAQARVMEEGLAPVVAVWLAAGEIAGTLAAGGGYLAERVRDVHDVRDRIVAELSGLPAPGVPAPAFPFVLLAHDLAPADTATLDRERVLAIVTEAGGPTSHTSILARALGIPAVVGAPGSAGIAEGDELLVDGGAGLVLVGPDNQDRQRVEQLAAAGPRTFDGHGRTADGRHVPLLANVGDPRDAKAAAAAGAEGIGLFRTEFCFLSRPQAPSVPEQIELYAEVLGAFPGKRVVFRTLDAGADKPMPFLAMGAEPNPALGVRGIRTSWDRADLLDGQLEAIATASTGSDADVWVMAPMIATLEETEAFVAACAGHGLATAGVMVEVPAAALQAEVLLGPATFASIGTNDLLQYTMAADRMLAPLSRLNDPFQPGLLRLVQATCRAGTATGRPVGICGEAAADPAMACVLVGLGVGSLSMSASVLPDVAAALAGATHQECVAAADAALAAPTATAARSAARQVLGHLTELGL